MEHEYNVPQTGVSPQGWKETHTSPHKPVHLRTQTNTHNTHTHTHTHTHTQIYIYIQIIIRMQTENLQTL